MKHIDLSNRGNSRQTKLEALRILARRVHGASINLLTAPLGALLGVVYLFRASRWRLRPRGHRVTVVTILEDWAITLLFLGTIGAIWLW
ncbi:MAG: hypothetical protein RL885_07860 [Planctomycetota bacterium]